jgi:hypothetical protein
LHRFEYRSYRGDAIREPRRTHYQFDEPRSEPQGRPRAWGVYTCLFVDFARRPQGSCEICSWNVPGMLRDIFVFYVFCGVLFYFLWIL